MKRLFVCGAALIFMALPAGAAEFGMTPVGKNTAPIAATEPLNPVVQLVDGDKMFCTGFYIGAGRFVTAGHCASDATSPMHIRMQNGTFRELDVEIIVVSDPDKGMPDFAILEGDKNASSLKDRNPVVLDCGHKSKVGEDIRSEGFPGGLGFITTWGKVSGPTEKIGPWKKPVTRTNIAVAGGNSGGPIFVDKTGAVLGILVGALSANADLSLVQPIGPVCSLLGLK